ncbi:MAG: hypothetical protein AB7F99_09305 [Vicinamibacterales bacterium]
MKRTMFAMCSAVALLSSAATSSAQLRVDTREQPRFEEEVSVTASPRPGSPSDHFMTFSGPVSVPGAVLPAGTYIFRLAGDGKKVLQILKADRSETYAMFHTMQVEEISRGLTSDSYVVTWDPTTDDDDAPALNAWYVPHQARGYRFVYDNMSQ